MDISHIGNKKQRSNHGCINGLNAGRRYIPEKCTACSASLNIGMAFIICMCHLHAVCSNHDITEMGALHACPFCDEKERKQKPLPPPPEVKNSLPILDMASARTVIPSPRSLLYDYPDFWGTLVFIDSMSYDRTITIPILDTVKTFWDAGADNIILGGWNNLKQPILNAVSVTGQIVQHVLSCGRAVISGCAITKWLHIVCVRYNDNTMDTSNNKIHIVTLDHDSIDSSVIHPRITLDVINPMNVFRKSTQLYGVLCLNRSSRPFETSTIRLLGLDQLILPTDTDTRTIQSTALWGRRTLLHLDLIEPSVCDKVAVTHRGFYCVSSMIRGYVQVYSSTGVYLYTLCEESPRKYFVNAPFPFTMQCRYYNWIVVTGMLGDIHMYDVESKTGSLVTRHDVFRYDSIEEYNNFGIRKVHYFKDNPEGWRMLRDVVEGCGPYILVTTTRLWDIQDVLKGIRLYR